ncbi:MAG TPA: NUDIX hydrolase [Gemmatimonadaceae bacterium]|nr:NUDIX hydrolase [Gemmatimonadaceae bacterium]
MSARKKKPDVVTGDEIRTRTRGGKPAHQLDRRELYKGKIFRLDKDTVRFPDGSESEFDIVRHPGAAAVVPFLSDPEGEEPQILLLRQFRYAADGYIYEIPAGRLDAGEAPKDCAVRELKEETGCTADRIEPLFTMFTTPGFTDETIHVFMATGLTHGQSAREPDEFAEVVIMRLAEALELIQQGAIPDGKTALAILFAAGFRTGG